MLGTRPVCVSEQAAATETLGWLSLKKNAPSVRASGSYRNRRCGPPSCERREALHQFDFHDGKSLIGVRVDDQAELSGKPEFRQKVRHGLDAVHGFDAAEFDPS